MKEKDFQRTFNHWLKAVHKKTGLFELKITKGALPFSAVAPHQVEALLNAKHSCLYYKIPDVGYQNPADAFGLCGEEAYVVIKYPKAWYMIDIDAFLKERDSSSRKSLTEERAKEIALSVDRA